MQHASIPPCQSPQLRESMSHRLMNPEGERPRTPSGGRDSAPPAALAEADFFCEVRPRLGVIGRNHGIFVRQIPFLAILLGRKVVMSPQVALDGFEFLSILETGDVIGGHR